MPHNPPAREAEDAPGVPLDDAGCVADSLPCRGCGYDLKGIAADAVCPECAAPVARSLHGDLLRYCDRDWLARLRQGLLLVVFGIVGGTAVQITTMAAAIAVSVITGATGGMANAMTTVIVAGGLAMALVTLLNIAGAWLLTTQDPGRTETEPPLGVRTVARFAIMASLVAAPMQMVLGESGAFTGSGRASLGVQLTLMGFTTFMSVIALVGWVAFYLHVRQIALRVPIERYARQLRVITWGYAISTSVSLLFGTISMIMVATGRMPIAGTGQNVQVTGIVVGLGSCASVIFFIAFELWAAVLFLRLRSRLNEMI